MAERMLDPSSLEARMKYGRPEDVQSIEPERRSLMSRAGSAIQEGAERLGVSRTASRKLGGIAQTAGEMAPVTGDAAAIEETARALGEGEYGEAAVSGMAIIPVIGKALSRGAKVSMELFRSADKAVQEAAIRQAAMKLERIPNPDKAEDVEELVMAAKEVEDKIKAGVPRKGTEPVSFGRDRDNPMLYHGTDREEKAASIEESGLRTGNHQEVSLPTTSLSRDPIYSARHFADSAVERLFGVKLTDEAASNVGNMSTKDYDRLQSKSMDMSTPTDDLEMKYSGGANIPKVPAFASEHETAVTDAGLADAVVARMGDLDPDKAVFIKKGVEEAQQVIDDQSKIAADLVNMRIGKDGERISAIDGGKIPAAEARRMYTRIRDNMKQAVGLAKYTEDNSARGTYDWYLKNWSDKTQEVKQDNGALLEELMDEDPYLRDEVEDMLMDEPYMEADEILEVLGVNPDMAGEAVRSVEADEIVSGLRVLKNSLGEQPAKEIDSMIKSINAGRRGQYGTATNVRSTVQDAKVGGGDVKEIMARRKDEIAEVNAMLEMGEIDNNRYKKIMESITIKYKPMLQKAKEQDTGGMMGVAERMNKGGLVK